MYRCIDVCTCMYSLQLYTMPIIFCGERDQKKSKIFIVTPDSTHSKSINYFFWYFFWEFDPLPLFSYTCPHFKCILLQSSVGRPKEIGKSLSHTHCHSLEEHIFFWRYSFSPSSYRSYFRRERERERFILKVKKKKQRDQKK